MATAAVVEESRSLCQRNLSTTDEVGGSRYALLSASCKDSLKKFPAVALTSSAVTTGVVWVVRGRTGLILGQCTGQPANCAWTRDRTGHEAKIWSELAEAGEFQRVYSLVPTQVLGCTPCLPRLESFLREPVDGSSLLQTCSYPSTGADSWTILSVRRHG